MANIKQQIKRVRSDAKRRQANQIVKSSLKRTMKKVENYVEQNDKDNALSALNQVNKKLDKALAKGVYHKNYVSRHKSRMAKLVNSL